MAEIRFVELALLPCRNYHATNCSDYKMALHQSTIQNTVIYLVYHTRRINLALEIQNPPNVYEDGYCTWANSPPIIGEKKKPKNHFTSFYIVWNGRDGGRFLSKNQHFEVINSIAIAGEWRGWWLLWEWPEFQDFAVAHSKNEKLHGKKWI